MDVQDILFVVALTVVPSAMSWRAYVLGYRQGSKDERIRQNRRARYSSRRNSRHES